MKPCTELSGVRNSWETIEMKLERTRLTTLSVETSRAVKTTYSPFSVLMGVTLVETSTSQPGVVPMINSSLGRAFCSCLTRVSGQLEVPHRLMRFRLRQHNISEQ